MSVAVAVEDLTKRYAKRTVLDGVGFALREGRFLCLLGPSGSGKSTLLRLICGFERPERGRIDLFGSTVSTPRRCLAPERRDLALVFQDCALWPHLTALENVRFALRRRGLKRREELLAARAALERVGLGFAADRYPHQLSGGEQQRVGLARALVARPPLILFDEPLSALDAELREQLRLEIATLVREVNATAIYITHDQLEAFALGDLVGVMREGRLLQLCPPRELFERPPNRFVAAFTGIAGELRGRALACAKQADGRYLIRIEIAGRRLAGLAPRPLAGGEAAVLSVRPAAVRVGGEGANLRAVVKECAFLGSGWRYALELEGGGLLSGVAGAQPLARGERLAAALDPSHCHVFADGPRRPPAPAAPRPSQPPAVAEPAREVVG